MTLRPLAEPAASVVRAAAVLFVLSLAATTRAAIDAHASPRLDVPQRSAAADGAPDREHTFWVRGKGAILGASLLVSLEAGLIVALVRIARRRREAQRLLEGRLRIEILLSDVLLAATTLPPAQFDSVLDAALARIAAALGFDGAWRWSFRSPEGRWDSAQLRAGDPVVFTDISELPSIIQAKLRAADCASCSALAIPLTVGGDVVGALFWASRVRSTPWKERLDELRMIANCVSTVLQRKTAESALEQSDRLKGAILASLHANVVVLDRIGTIISVNDAWMDFGRGNGVTSEAAIGVGSNYLNACLEGARRDYPGAREALVLIESACRGEHSRQQIEYQCNSPERVRWFLMTAEPLRRPEGGAVVTHSDITERKINEMALRESEGRFRRMADALPVAIWMSDEDGACTYVNKQWLDMTGRTPKQEAGVGWLEGVHPDDRGECLETYVHAFNARQRFSMEYRIRHHDGEYRWLIDTGMPRYGGGGEFHGYIGGCLDITSRKEAEQMMRDLSRRLIVAQEDERRRIARELHDHLNQQLALLAIDLQQLSINPPATPDVLAAVLQEEWRRTTEIASDVHAISHRLHPSKLAALGLVTTMRAHCRDMSRQNFGVHFSEQNVPSGIPPDVALCLFRVLEEALSNVAHHSGAPDAHVLLRGTDAEIVLRVCDSGHGFAANQRSTGLGVVSMRERLQLIGGTFSITSAPGHGTVVEARAPRVWLSEEEPDYKPPPSPRIRKDGGDAARAVG